MILFYLILLIDSQCCYFSFRFDLLTAELVTTHAMPQTYK